MERFKSRGIRVATKVQEKEIKEMALQLKKNPLMVLPECQNECRKCYFKGLRAKIEKIEGADERKLEKYSSGKDLAAAVAGTILLADSKISYFAAKKIGNTTYVYARKGKARDEKLLAVQNFKDPHIRMLGIMDIASKKKIYVYSVQNKMICRGNNPAPPSEFMQFVMKKLGVEKGMCRHLLKGEKRTYIKIEWLPAKTEIKICEECASRNTMMEMTKYFYSPNIENEFKAEVIGEFISCNKKCDECLISEALETKMDDSYYIQGKIDDKKFIENWHKKVQWNIEKMHEGVIILDGICYGRDAESAMKKLKPSKWEEIALNYIFGKIEKPLIMENATPNKIISNYWNEHGNGILKEIAGDDWEKFADRKSTPPELLERAYMETEKSKILKNLPSYKNLPPLAEFADRIARAYRVGGHTEAMKEIHGENMDVKKKAIAYAFLLAFNKAEGEEWKYSDMEKDFGRHLMRYASELLKKEGEEYGKVLQEMLTMTGSTQKLEE